MVMCPPMYADAPQVQPRPSGLFSAAIFPPNTDAHFQCGVEFEPMSCGLAFTTHDPCREQGSRVVSGSTTNASTTFTSSDANFTASDVGRSITGPNIPAGTTITAVTNSTTATLSAPATATGTGSYTIGAQAGFPAALSVPAGVPLVAAEPFTVYAGFRCSLVGRDLPDAQARAEAALAFGEQRAVEFAFWTGSEGNDPRLATPSAVILGTGAMSPDGALGALEGYIAKNYGGTGVLHAPAELSANWAERVMHMGVGQPIVTHLGTKIAYGGGYSQANTSPSGVAAPAGQAWVYATGAVAIWRSPVFFSHDPVSQAFDKKNNTVELLASRTYVVSRECILAAALVDLPGNPTA